MPRRSSQTGFTLVELLVVITLMSLAVGMTVFRLDGVSAHGRLRSTATQLAAVLHLARTEAQASGTPRLLEYQPDARQVVARRPTVQDGTWEWGTGIHYELSTRVPIVRVTVEGDRESEGEDQQEGSSIRVDANGNYRAHAIVLGTGDRCVVVLFRPLEEPEYVFRMRLPQAPTFALLLVELELSDEDD